MRSRKLLALLFYLITYPATAGYMTLLGAGVGSISPTVSWVAGTDPFPDTFLSYSGPSLSMMFDSTGKLTYKPNNLLLNTATLGTQTVTVQVGVNYLLSIKGTGTVTLTGASTSGPLNGTGASNRVDLKITAATSSLTLTVSGSVTSARLSAVTYETALRSQDDVDTTASAYYGPRIDYDPNTLAVKGILIEQARTNLITYSQDFSNAAWAKSGTISSAGTNPTGVTGQLLTLSAGSSQKILIPTTVTVVTATSYAGSYFVKPNGYTKVALRESISTGAYAAFDLTGAGSVLDSGSGGTGSVTLLANGWYRITMVSVSSGTSFRPDLWVLDPTYTSGSVIGSWTADGTSGVYVFGAQLETGTCSTSYIPNYVTGSTTRALDLLTFTGAALAAFQGAAFSAVLELNGSQGIINGTTGILTTNASQYPIYVASNTVGSSYNGTTGLTTTLGGGATFTGTAPLRIAIAGDASGRSFVANNGTLTTDTNKMFPTAVTTAYLGSLAGTFQFNGCIGKIALYIVRIPNTKLKAVTVADAPFVIGANDNDFPRYAENDNLPILRRAM
jgi:hypothetical protein